MSRTLRPLRLSAAFAMAALSSCTGLSVPVAQRQHSVDPGAHPGGKLVVAITAPASVDPGSVTDDSGMLISSLVCEPLVQIDPTTREVDHGLVESAVSGGRGTSIVLKLRTGVRFSNGAVFNAQDVVYALSRIARQDYAAPGADLLSPVLGYQDVHSLPPPTQNVDPSKRVLSGVQAISNSAVLITLQTPDAEFLRVLSLPLAAPVPHRLPDRDSRFGSEPICVGPYRFAKPYHAGDQTIELERSPGYYGGNDAFARGGKGYADAIEFKLEPDQGKAYADFVAGNVDVVRVPLGNLEQARHTPEDLFTSPVPQIDYVGLPTLGPLGDPSLRALLSKALDRDRLVHDVFGGGRLPATGFIPPNLTDHIPDTCKSNIPVTSANPSASVDPRVASLKDQSVTLTINDDYRNRTLAEAVASQWHRALGLRVAVIATPWNQYLKKVTDPKGILTAFRESWQPRYPSVDELIYPLFHSSEIGTNNWARYDDPDFDRRLDRVVRREDDDALRLQKYLSLEDTLCRDLPLIPVSFGLNEYMINTRRLGSADRVYFDRSTGRILLRNFFVRNGSGT